MFKIVKKLAPLLLFVSLFLVPMTSHGQVNFFKGCERAPNTEFCEQASSERSKNRITGPNGILTRIVTYITFATAAISVILVVVGGFRYVISGGDPNGTKQAKDTILYALIGLVVSIFAYVIVGFVISKL